MSIAIAGCQLTNRDVSRDLHFSMGYRVGEVYRLKQPVHLRSQGDWRVLTPPDEPRGTLEIIRTVPAGTRLEIQSLRHKVSAAPIQWESYVEVLARLQDDAEQTVVLWPISHIEWVDGDWAMKSSLPRPNPAFLELVADGAPQESSP